VRLFFNPGPFFFDPALDFRLISLDGLALGFLGAPTQGSEKTANVIYMIVDAQVGIDPLGDAGAGPKVGGESGCFGSSKELFLEFGFFSGIELGWATRGGFCVEGIWAMGREGSFPSSDASAVYLQFFGNFNRREAVLKEGDGAPSSSFQDFWASGRSHNLPPAQSIGHYLCRCQ
jgi:hypothetical protein